MWGSPRNSSSKAANKRDLPIPGSPEIMTIRPLTGSRLCPATEQQIQLLLAADQRRQRCCMQRFEADSRLRLSATTCQARTGSGKPFRETKPRSGIRTDRRSAGGLSHRSPPRSARPGLATAPPSSEFHQSPSAAAPIPSRSVHPQPRVRWRSRCELAVIPHRTGA